ncbi:MAG: energy-coupling factor ABC transporter ATP-binding protein [Propionibacteriaceae bacterium]|nr:energy-coupling factor ABC transporter ATP-binding protein [Propionibacteriaceae bacterium]
MLHVKDLIIDYADGTRAVDGLSFSVAAGENVALIGANGAGKTSLLLSLVGILTPASGEILINDLPLSKDNLRQIRSQVGLVFQNPDDQLFMPTIGEDIGFGPRSFGYDEAETASRVTSALEELGIVHLGERSPLKLSSGEKRLAAIGTVLALSPTFLLFDEPTAFLDPRARRNLTSILGELPQGKLIATHDLSFAEQVCTRVLLVQKGKLVEDSGTGLLADESTLETAGL